MKYYAIIVAGGSGNRMNTDIPKQFLKLQNLPVLMHTINAFHSSNYKPEILLVLNTSQHKFWAQLCAEHNFNIPHTIIDGGRERFFSVQNALNNIHKMDEGCIAVHDAVRPLVSVDLIDNCYKHAESNTNAVAAVSASDSIRRLTGNKSESLKREEIFMVQTPQTFQTILLKNAYKQPYNTHFTDDASVVEQFGYDINLVPGERENIKITYPIDLEYANMILNKKAL